MSLAQMGPGKLKELHAMITSAETIKGMSLMHAKENEYYTDLQRRIAEARKIPDAQQQKIALESLTKEIDAVQSAAHQGDEIDEDAALAILKAAAQGNKDIIFIINFTLTSGGGHSVCAGIFPSSQCGVLYDPNCGSLYMPSCDLLMVRNITAFISYAYVPSSWSVQPL